MSNGQEAETMNENEIQSLELFEKTLAVVDSEGKAPSESDEWSTPQPLFEALHQRFHFTLDAAASVDNAKLPRFWQKSQDALKQTWDVAERIWCNPPYSKPNIPAFLSMGRNHAARGGTSCFLVPNSTSEVWFHQILRGSDVLTVESVHMGPLEGWGLKLTSLRCNLWLHFLLGRLSFGHAGVKRGESAKKGNVVVAFLPRGK